MEYIFYHGSDFDGMCSGAIMKRFCEPETKLYAFEYAYEFPEDFTPMPDDTVYFVDVTANPYSRILDLAMKTNVVVIDHHKSFIEWAAENVPDTIRNKWVLDTKQSGCMLCWQYANPGKQLPRAVWLFGHYDIWDNADQEQWNNVILPFQYGARGIKIDDDESWNILLNDDLSQLVIDNIISKGKILLEYIKASNASVVKKHSFETTFEGYKVLACNTHNFSSQTFEYLWDETKYDFMVAFEFSRGEKYWVSLYTSKADLDLSKIASKYGGGGHAQACGFNAKRISFGLDGMKVDEI